jgi:hypothetical protein
MFARGACQARSPGAPPPLARRLLGQQVSGSVGQRIRSVGQQVSKSVGQQVCRSVDGWVRVGRDPGAVHSVRGTGLLRHLPLWLRAWPADSYISQRTTFMRRVAVTLRQS